MANKLYYFNCLNFGCNDKENFVELPEGEYKKTKYLLYCGACGVCLLSDARNEVQIDKGKTWLPCIPFTGQGSCETRGPVSDSIVGFKWGDASGNENLIEDDFMKKYGINPRVEWCKRTNHARKDICKGKGAIKPVVYDKVDVIDPVVKDFPGPDLGKRRTR